MQTALLALIARFARDGRGNIALMSSLLFSVLVMCAAFGVDEGALYYDRRQLQGAADVAAIVAAGNIGNADRAARAALLDNGYLPKDIDGLGIVQPMGQYRDVSAIEVQTGSYRPARSTAPDQRFTPGGSNPNAVRVSVRSPGALYFASMFAEPPTLSAEAIASTEAIAAFSIGSRLLSLNDGILNALLSGLLDTTISLDVMDYTALANANLSLPDFLDELAKEVGLKAGTYDALLAEKVTYRQLTTALSKALAKDASANRAMSRFSKQAAFSRSEIPLSELFNLRDAGGMTIGEPGSRLELTVNALEVVGASAALGGENQIALDLSTAIPGVASSSVYLTLGERPQGTSWFNVGGRGSTVQTAQTRLRLVLQVGGTGLLAGTTLRIPVYLDLAFAEATLENIYCPAKSGKDRAVRIAAKPGVADLWIGDVTTAQMKDLANPANVKVATFAKVPLITVTGSAHVNIGNMKARPLDFSIADIESHSAKSVSTTDVAAPLFASLLGDLKLTVKVAGLGLNADAIGTSVSDVLKPLAPAVDSSIRSLLGLLGIKVGEADVWANGVQCGRAVLVQ
ncbi:MAG: pilus assembly protein TadG-related protein [Proteobacteria bacterium]|nr:pilus assembly protein TadG-related protein [Pseudomonadota bacterium]